MKYIASLLVVCNYLIKVLCIVKIVPKRRNIGLFNGVMRMKSVKRMKSRNGVTVTCSLITMELSF